ncbi:MAG: DNA polymerase III subunit delta' [Deltaproteobacteria bacterium]|nr:DNA polymerase III subunit delta' [Deltaproteobacteria bacterium]
MWQQLIGHDRPVASLRADLSADRLAPAYLFAGPAGIGKFRTALTLAQAINCTLVLSERSPELAEGRSESKDGPCGECATCTRIAAGTHPDVLIIAPEKQEIRIEQVRTMQARLQLHALEGNVKLALIDVAEAMHPAAANACLKILEEPPTATHFILISANPHRLLPTIRSRCRSVTFHPLSTSMVAEWLVTRQQAAPAAAAQIAALSDGSIGFALACEPVLIAETSADLAALCWAPTAASVLATSERWAADGAALPARLRCLVAALRTALGRRLAGESAAPSPLAEIAAALVNRPPRRLQTLLQRTLTLAREVESTTLNKQLLCESLLFTFAGSWPSDTNVSISRPPSIT